jgi:glucokinase
MLLVGDIGGTKTILALFSIEEKLQPPLEIATFPSSAYASLEAIIADFLKGKDVSLTRASFGVAGPVVHGRARITNLPWTIDAAVISRAFAIETVYLLNDLESIANAIPHLEPADLVALNPGMPEPGGPMAVIAPGTGLGEAFLIWNGHRYQACPSEGGHVSFAPTTQEQLELLAYLRTHFGHVSYERVCSGSGIPNLYNYLRDKGRYSEPGWLREELAAAADPTPVIVSAAIARKASICEAALNLFIEILGDEAGNLALKILATGGVYIGGGIPPRILPPLQEPGFLDSFTRKGRFSGLMARIPVHVIRNPQVALYGAAYYGLKDLQHG